MFKNKKTKEYKSTEKNKGIAILFSVIVAVLMVAIGATITSIAMRQTILSSTGKESQFAFYAANTGLECARYWDWYENFDDNNVAFPLLTTGGGNEQIQTTDLDDINCAGGSIVDGAGFDNNNGFVDGWDTTGNVTVFEIALNPDGGADAEYCAEVTVEKIDLDDPVEDPDKSIGTIITSKGYNTCDKTSARAVERGLEMYYEY